jgi:type II secretory pathway component PulM
MNRILSFWTSLQDRERAIMKILAIAILIGFASLFYTNILGSINQNKNILMAKKNEFNYVYQQAQRIQLFSNSQQLLLDAQNLNEFLLAESNSFGLVNFQISEEGGKNIISFSDASIANASKFLNKASTHPSIEFTFISITPNEEGFNLKTTLIYN